MDEKIVVCGYELPPEEKAETIEVELEISVDVQIFNAFMNRG
ncbi:anti-DarT factor AdfA family protein [Xanthomonas pisi]